MMKRLLVIVFLVIAAVLFLASGADADETLQNGYGDDFDDDGDGFAIDDFPAEDIDDSTT
jgi:hypothetical protein